MTTVRKSFVPEALPEPRSPESRAKVAGMLMELFKHWQLDTGDQLALLGMSPDSRATLSRYRAGQALEDRRDLLDRAGHLLAIHKSLRILFPQNRDLAYRWMSARNTNFDNRTPVEMIREHGFPGLLMVRAYLDRERGR